MNIAISSRIVLFLIDDNAPRAGLSIKFMIRER